MTPMQIRAPCPLFLKNILSSIKLRVTIYFRTDPKIPLLRNTLRCLKKHRDYFQSLKQIEIVLSKQ
jgi:hypothetical protein